MVGEELRAARLARGLNLEQVSEATKIRSLVIESMEAGDFGPCGGRAYARGQVRSLATVLGIDPDAIVDHFDAEYPPEPE
jgi:cytoskeletal protein RodZ